MAAARLIAPLLERGAVEPHLAARRLPHPDERAGERGLARCARPDDADRLAGFEREGHVLDHQPLLARGRDADALDRECRLGHRQRDRLRLLGQQAKQRAQPLPTLAGCDEALPVGDRQLDRRQRSRGQDRADDDDAGGRFLMNHQVGTDAEHGRLQDHAQDARNRA